MKSRFADLIQERMKDLVVEQGNASAPLAPISDTGVATASPQGQTPQAQPTQATQPGQQPQQAQQKPQQPADPSTALAGVFKTLPFNQGAKAVQMFNAAMKGAGNVPGMADFFKNAGFDAKTGQFVYNPQAQQPAAQPAVQTPGATATNT